MKIHINDIDYSIEEVEIALRYAACEALDAEIRAALLVAAAALQGLMNVSNGE